jgi:hypothetical protein
VSKLFSIASWNVEHFKNNPDRIDLVIEFLNKQNPDVFALYEVESSDIYQILVTRMPQNNLKKDHKLRKFLLPVKIH